MAVTFPVATMVARSGAELPADGRHAFEPKFDGWRCVAFRDRKIRLQSRQQRSLTKLFPDVAEAVALQLPPGTVVDGELVAMRGGRVDFAALHGRTGERCLVVFDVLAVGGRDVRGEPYRVRRERLVELLAVATGKVVLVPATEDPAGARAWMRRHSEDGIEGVVAKRLEHSYAPGRRWWSKHRTRLSAEAVVGGVIGPLDAPTALVLGRHDQRGRLKVVGRTIPLQRAAAEEVGRGLVEAHGPHPWPTVLPGGRFGLAGHDPVRHTPVEPLLVVELDVDTAFEHGRWRHGAKLRRVRHDLQPGDVTD